MKKSIIAFILIVLLLGPISANAQTQEQIKQQLIASIRQMIAVLMVQLEEAIKLEQLQVASQPVVETVTTTSTSSPYFDYEATQRTADVVPANTYKKDGKECAKVGLLKPGSHLVGCLEYK